MMELAARQVLACLSTFLEIPTEEAADIEGSLRNEAAVERWYVEWHRELVGQRKGYALHPVRKGPDLDDRLLEIAESSGLFARFREIKHTPTLCLTHDVDYLAPTTQLRIKGLVARRRLVGFRGEKDYLASLALLLRTDAAAAGREGASTVFLASRYEASRWSTRIKQWLIDPSYSIGGSEFDAYFELLGQHEAEVGLHGSFYSISEDLLANELTGLATRMGKPVRCSRQHWLNLPGKNALSRIREAGIRYDSTLGWNGTSGFRGGLAHPFPILFTNEDPLWEVPMPLMDGPLFDDLKLETDEVVELCINTLEEVFARRGCVALNWHERAAHSDYRWFEAYEKIVGWAKKKGFAFLSIPDACDKWARRGCA